MSIQALRLQIGALLGYLSVAATIYSDLEKSLADGILDDNEKAQAVAKFKALFELENDVAEALVEDGFEWALSTFQFGAKVISQVKKDPAPELPADPDREEDPADLV